MGMKYYRVVKNQRSLQNLFTKNIKAARRSPACI